MLVLNKEAALDHVIARSMPAVETVPELFALDGRDIAPHLVVDAAPSFEQERAAEASAKSSLYFAAAGSGAAR